MPKIYANEAVSKSGVTKMEGDEIRNAYTGKNAAFIGFKGKDAAAYVNFRDYRFLMAAKELAGAIQKQTGQEIPVPQLIADAIENAPSINVDTSVLREFPDDIAHYDVPHKPHDRSRPSAAEIKEVSDRKHTFSLYSNKSLRKKDVDRMTHLSSQERRAVLESPTAEAVVVAHEDAAFTQAITSLFADSADASWEARQIVQSQVGYDALLLRAMFHEYARVTGKENFPSDIVDTFTRFDEVRDVAEVKFDGEGYILGR